MNQPERYPIASLTKSGGDTFSLGYLLAGFAFPQYSLPFFSQYAIPPGK
jgi:hypothetical protein